MVVFVGFFGAMLACPTPEFRDEVDQFGAGGGEPIVGVVGVLVVLDQTFCLQVLQRAGQGLGVDDGRTGLRYGMHEMRVPQWPVPQGVEDGTVQLAA